MECMKEIIKVSSIQESEGSPQSPLHHPQVSGRTIKLPLPWNRERDHREFVDRFGNADCPLDFLLGKLPGDYERFNLVLDNAVNHFLGENAFAQAGGVGALSAQEKIEWLLELVATRSARASYRARLEDDLAECLFIDSERRRVLRGYLRANEEPWLYPLCELADGFIGCAMQLEESLICEQCGYQQPLVFHNEAIRFAATAAGTEQEPPTEGPFSSSVGQAPD